MMKKSTRYLYLAAALLFSALFGWVLIYAVQSQKMWIVVGEMSLLVVYGAVVYVFRNKLIKRNLGLPADVMEKQIRLFERSVKTLKIGLIGLPLLFLYVIVVLPSYAEILDLDYFFGEGFIPLVIAMILFYVGVWQLFLVERWLIQELKTGEASAVPQQ